MTTIKDILVISESKKSTSVLIGFILALSLLFISFEWSRADSKQDVTKDDWILVEPVDMIPNTEPDKVLAPPPPVLKPQISDIIQVIDKDIPENQINNQPEVSNQNAGLNTNIDVYKSIGTTEEPVDITPVDFAEVMPEFPGDVFEYLSKNVHYPRIAIDDQIQGKVYCQFVVNKDGSIVDVQVVRSVHSVLDNEAIRVISGMPKWKPGRQGGRTVRVRFILPVNFKLM